MTITVWHFASILVAGVVVVISLVCGGLYLDAYYRMKKTRIILDIALVMFAIAVKFGMNSILYYLMAIGWSSENSIATMGAGIIPNVLILASISLFIYHSVKTPKEAQNCLTKVDKKDIRNL